MDFDQAVAESKIEYISEAVEQKYLDAVKARSIHPEALEEANMQECCLYSIEWCRQYAGTEAIGTNGCSKCSRCCGTGKSSMETVQPAHFPNPEIREALGTGDPGLPNSKTRYFTGNRPRL